MIGAVMVRISSSGGGEMSFVRVVSRGFVPPVLRTRRPVGVFVDAVDRARVEALAAAGAELGDDDHVDAVIEDGAELRRAMTDAGVADDAPRPLAAQWPAVSPTGTNAAPARAAT